MLLRHGPIVVSSNGRHLQHLDGTPFFWLGDTVWNGPALSSKDDWNTYLEDREKKHFSVVQFNAICPWRAAAADADGKTAFSGERGVRINPEYFRRLDARMDAINAHGLLAAPVLIWANKADDPGNALPEADVVKLLRYEVARYGASRRLDRGRRQRLQGEERRTLAAHRPGGLRRASPSGASHDASDRYELAVGRLAR